MSGSTKFYIALAISIYLRLTYHVFSNIDESFYQTDHAFGVSWWAVLWVLISIVGLWIDFCVEDAYLSTYKGVTWFLRRVLYYTFVFPVEVFHNFLNRVL